MKRSTLFIDEALESDLRVLARNESRPVSSFVHEAISEYVRKQRRGGGPKLSFTAVGRSGRNDTAERHEELLWNEPGAGFDCEAVGSRPERHPARRRPKAHNKT